MVAGRTRQTGQSVSPDMRSKQNGTQRQPAKTVEPQAGVTQSDTTAHTRSDETRPRSSETISVPPGAEPSASGGLRQTGPEPLDLIGDRRRRSATAGGAAGHRHPRFEQRRRLSTKLRIGSDEFTQRAFAGEGSAHLLPHDGVGIAERHARATSHSARSVAAA